MEVPSPDGGARILAKHESVGPGGCAQGRVAYALFVKAALKYADDPEPLRLLSYADDPGLVRSLDRLTRLTGVPIRCAVPQGSVAAGGMAVDVVEVRGGGAALVDRALRIAMADPGRTLLHPLRDTAAVATHQYGTGAEILSQTGGRPLAAWVATVRTGASLAGVSRALRPCHPGVRTVAVAPAGGHRADGVHGAEPMRPFLRAYVPGAERVSAPVPVPAVAHARLERETGLRAGPDAAASWAAAWQVADSLPAEATVVTAFPDARWSR
ncbi:pyridoxal-phosphate dependent enzyme [Streptomyces sp. NPDC055400]